VRLR
jgi:hypothetical protein